ncbi:MAG: succinylglutamate desuccinylase/aspartoacylase family protein [Alphaproteobacteria bacterium]|nr:succinylglutamate desuccinylase/aspartoacylase family protein [Alphaproteobacteria bacterium]
MHTGAHIDIETNRDGKQVGHVSLPHSVDRSPFFQIKLPIAQIRNGEGPQVLLLGGVHGDEYEGSFALNRAICAIEAKDIVGRLTILPTANGPAALAGRRCSPLDGGNLNRAFPGDPFGTPTQRIAYFIEHDLMPGHDVLFDLHSGGTSMDFIQCGLCEVLTDADRFRQAKSLMGHLGLPYNFIADNTAQSPTSLAAAGRAGLVGISAELGGGGTVTPNTMRATLRAIDNLLAHLGMTTGPIWPDAVSDTQEAILLKQGDQKHNIQAPRRGWYEPAVSLGETVRECQIVAWHHDLESPAREPEEIRSTVSGVVVSRRLHAHVEGGDCLLLLMERAT